MACCSLRGLLLCFALSAGGSVVSNAMAKDAGDMRIAVIVSRLAPLTTIDRNLLRSVYLKKIFLDATNRAYVPVNLPPDSMLRRDFTFAVIHLDEPQLQSYWNRQYFQGISPPFVLGSQTAVVDFVSKTPGAVGYVRLCYINTQVKVVLLLRPSGAPADGAPEPCPSVDGH